MDTDNAVALSKLAHDGLAGFERRCIHDDRQLALELFDAFGSQEKTLQANLGGHTGVPHFAAEDAARFLVRHLK